MASGTFTADNIGNADPVIVDGQCNEVTIQENAKANTTSYRIYDPDLNASPQTLAPSEAYVFRRVAPWGAKQTIGYVEVLDVASATFRRQEALK